MEFRRLVEENPILVGTLQKCLSNGVLVLKTRDKKCSGYETIELPYTFSWVFVEDLPLWPQFIMSLIEAKINANSPLAIILTDKECPVKNWLTCFGLNELPACVYVDYLTPNTVEKVNKFLARHR